MSVVKKSKKEIKNTSKKKINKGTKRKSVVKKQAPDNLDQATDNFEVEEEDVLEDYEKNDVEPKFTKKKIIKEKKKDEVEEDEEEEIIEESKEDKGIDQELNEIYGNGDGTMPDMKHFEEKKKSGFFTAFFVLVGSCTVLALVAWLGFFVFQPQSRFNEEDVILSVVGDEEITAGQETHYRVRYRNAQNIPLAKVLLQVRYPEGFIFDHSEPEPTNDNRDEWNLGSLDEQDSGYIDVWGKMYGDLEKKQSFRVFLNYIPSNFSAEFQKVSTLSTQVMKSPIDMEVSGSDKVNVGTETEFVITLHNNNTSSTENLALVIEPGDNFIIKSSDPSATEDNQYQWNVDEVEENQEIRIIGVFSENVTEDKVPVTFKLLFWKDGSREGDGYEIQSYIHETEIIKTELSVNLIINGTVNDFFAQPGDILTANIVIKNNGGELVKDIDVRAVLNAPSVDSKSLLKWIDLEDEADGRIAGEQMSSNIRRGSIEWDSQNIFGLASLAPGEEIIIDFSIPIKNADDVDLNSFSNHIAVMTVDLKYKKNEEQKTLTSNQIEVLVNSDTTIGVQDTISHTDDTNPDGGKDIHTIAWIINNTFHELKDIKVEADLYGDITVPEENIIVPAGNASYEEDNKKLVWTVNSMPTSLDVLAFQFDVIIHSDNPSQKNLTSKVRFTAVDVITGETITFVGDEVLLN